MQKKDLSPVERYKKKQIKQYPLQLNRNTNAEMIDFLESLPNKSGFIKEAITEKMQKIKQL